MPEQSFPSFLWRWVRTATDDAVEALGLSSLLLGAVFWAWHKYRPNSLKVAGGYFRITPDMAMTDLVWQIPLAVGFIIFAYRLARAPYEIVLSERAQHAKDEAMLKESVWKNIPDLVGLIDWMIIRESELFHDQCEMLITVNVVNAGASTIVQHWVVLLRTEEGKELTLTKSDPLPHETLTFETDVLTDIQGADFIKYKTAPDAIPRRGNRRGFVMCRIPKDLSQRWSVVVRFNDALGKTWETNRYVPADRPKPKSFREIGGWPDLDIRHRPLGT